MRPAKSQGKNRCWLPVRVLQMGKLVEISEQEPESAALKEADILTS
jgi:hypothetical protein